MAEPKIKARLVLDTSQLDGIKGSSGGVGGINTGTNEVEKKKDSGYLKLMAETIGGPLKQAALVSLKTAAIAGTIFAANQAGEKIGENLGVGTTPAEAFTLLNSQDALGRTGEESFQSVIESLKIKAENLEDAGDFEGAQKIRDQMQEVSFYLEQLQAKANEWDGNLEDAREETKKAKGRMKLFVSGVETLIGATTGIWLDLDGSDNDNVSSQTDEAKEKTKTWNANLGDIVDTTQKIKEAYKTLLAGIPTKINIGSGRSIGTSISPSGQEFNVGSDITPQEINAAAQSEQDASGVTVSD